MPIGPLVNAATRTITSGGTWQQLFAANQNRSTLWIENYFDPTVQGVDPAESLFVAFGDEPQGFPDGYELIPGGSLVMADNYISQQAVWVYAATTAHAFQAMQSE